MNKAEKIVTQPRSMISVLMLGTFVGLFGETALNMALTNLMEQFVISAGLAQWLVTGYLLTLAIFVPISAILVRWFNTRSLIISALLISLLGCVVAALAPNFAILMIGRVIQATGTGIILPVLMSAALLIFPLYQRGAVMGVIGLTITLAPALGPTLSGFILTSMNWHAIFWISALCYIAVLVLAFRSMEHIGTLTKPRIDIISLLLSSIGFSGVIYGLAVLAEHSITSVNVWGSVLIGILSLLLFCWRQKQLATPMINLQIFKHSIFVVGLLMMIVCMMSVLSVAIILPIYLKDVLLFSAAIAGILLLPGNIINVIFSPLIGFLYNRYDARFFAVIGALFMLLSASIFLVVINEYTVAWKIVIAFMSLCMGVTCVIMPAQTTALSDLTPDLYADGSAIWNTLYQVSGALGTSIAITLMSYFRENALSQNSAITALSFGTHAVFYFTLALSIIALLLAFRLKKPLAKATVSSK